MFDAKDVLVFHESHFLLQFSVRTDDSVGINGCEDRGDSIMNDDYNHCTQETNVQRCIQDARRGSCKTVSFSNLEGN